MAHELCVSDTIHEDSQLTSITSALHLLYGLLQLGKEQTAFADVIQLFLQFNFWTDPKTFTAANPKILTNKN